MGVTAALYTALTLLLAPISFGPVQLRIAEAFTMLPLIWHPGVAAVTLGCFLSNLLGAVMGTAGPIDILIGTLATLIAAQCTWRWRNNLFHGIPVFSILAPVVINGIMVGAELAWILNPGKVLQTFPLYCLSVAAGELGAVLLGYLLVRRLGNRGFFEELEK